MNTVYSKKTFFIPAGMTVTGTFTAEVPGQIAGAVNGDVIVNGKLVILKNGVVNGNVKALELEILGKVTGDIHCTGRMILQNTSFVKGNISTAEIHVEKDAVIDGIITKRDHNKTLPTLSFVPMEEISIEETIEDESPEIAEEVAEEIPEEVVNVIEEPVLIKVEEEEVQSWF